MMAYLVDNTECALVYWRAEQRTDMEYRCQDTIDIDFLPEKGSFPEDDDSPSTLLGTVDCSHATVLNG